MRLLVLDGSRVVGHLVRRFVPDDVDVKCVDSFDLVIDELLHHAPDAVIVDVTPAALPWHRVQEICHQHEPPIPVLWESCTCTDPVEAGIGAISRRYFFSLSCKAFSDLFFSEISIAIQRNPLMVPSAFRRGLTDIFTGNRVPSFLT